MSAARHHVRTSVLYQIACFHDARQRPERPRGPQASSPQCRPPRRSPSHHHSPRNHKQDSITCSARVKRDSSTHRCMQQLAIFRIYNTQSLILHKCATISPAHVCHTPPRAHVPALPNRASPRRPPASRASPRTASFESSASPTAVFSVAPPFTSQWRPGLHHMQRTRQMRFLRAPMHAAMGNLQHPNLH